VAPKRFLSIGLVQMAMSESREENLSKARRLVGEAAKKGAEVVCLPELFSTTYFPSEKGRNPVPEPIPGSTTKFLSDLARKNGVVLVGGSLFEQSGGKNYNTSTAFSEKGTLLGAYRKVHLPQDEHYYEQDYFSPGETYTVVKSSRGSLGLLICFDQWYPEAARANRLLGAQVLFYPTAIGWVDSIEPVEGDWKQAWEGVQVGHAISNSVIVCAVNRVGREGGTTFWGGSFVCNQFGKVLLRADEREGAFVTRVDLNLQRVVEDGWGFLRNRRTQTYGAISE
jgi:agmatine deiminase